MLQGSEMIPILLQSLEKAGSQSTQVALVTEAVSAANILVKLALVDINAGIFVACMLIYSYCSLDTLTIKLKLT